MPEDKPPQKNVKRLGTLASDAGGNRLGNLQGGDGAGTSSSHAVKSKFVARPVNFSRKKAAPELEGPSAQQPAVARKTKVKPENGTTVADSTGGGAAPSAAGGGSGGAQNRRRNQQRGAQVTKAQDIVAFGGGAYSHDVGGRRQVPYALEGKKKGGTGRGTGGGAANGGSRRLTKAGVKKEEGMDHLDGEIKAEYSEEEDDEDADWRGESDPIDYTQYFPTVLPWRGQDGQLPPPALTMTTDQLGDIQQQDRERAKEELEFLRNPEVLDEYHNDKKVFIMQLPPVLPLNKPHPSPITGGAAGPSSNGVDALGASSSSHPSTSHAAGELATARDLPPGRFGRFLILRSGKVKLQIGECLFDVDAGVPVLMRQEAASIDLHNKSCTMLGQINQRLVATPDFNFLMSGKRLPPMSQQFPCASGGVAQRPKTTTAAKAKARQIVDDDEDDEDDAGPSDKSQAAAGKAHRRQVIIDDDEDDDDDDVMEVDKKPNKAAEVETARAIAIRKGKQPMDVDVDDIKDEIEILEVIEPLLEASLSKGKLKGKESKEVGTTGVGSLTAGGGAARRRRK